MILTKKEDKILKSAFKSRGIGITNNQTFNDSTHSDSSGLQQTGSSHVFNEEEKKKEKEDANRQLLPNRSDD